MRRQWISIHLMFLLIRILALYLSKNIYFNTSHVSINHNNENEITKELSDFNTSHVSINLFRATARAQPLKISIHLMFLLINDHREVREGRFDISIHLMFLLICGDAVLYHKRYDFNTSHVSINQQVAGVSLPTAQFQYISCFY